MDRDKRIWYLPLMRAAKVQASLRIRAVSPEPPLLDHTSSESRGTFRQKTRSLAHLNGRACAIKICNDGMLEDTNSLDGAHINVAGGTNNASKNFYNLLGLLRINQVYGPPVTRSRSKNSKISPFNGRTRFCLMPVVTRLTPGTVNVTLLQQRR